MSRDPLRWAVLLVKKARLYWGWREIGHNKELAVDREHSRWLLLPCPVPLLVVLAGAWVLGAWSRRREPAARLGVVAAGAVFATFLLMLFFFVSARHRAPVMPLLCVLAGGGVAGMLAVARADRSKLGAPLLAMVVALAAISLPPAGRPPDRAKWHWRNGQLLSERGDEAAAERHFEAALAHDPGHGPSLTERALRLLDERDPEALRWARDAARASPEDPLARYAAGMALFYAGSLGEAAVELEIAARLGASARFEHALGMLHLARRDLSGAVDRFERALRLEPDSPEALTGLGLVHFSQERDERAEEMLRASLGHEPEQAQARYFLGLLLERSGRGTEALEHLRAAERLGQPGAAAARRRVEGS